MIGYLHVVEKYRRRGIASAILSMITKLIIEKDGFAFSSVLKDNVQSIKLHENVGFTQVQSDGSFFRLVPPA
ncbi:hypothetical protein FSP39_025110 [Pinctada imbricata]|uniref:N-acetyltransferase domain-containing protein n=1 Tax=Pinctada imbricata TaxID=66713 RepID=A0AA88Y3X7_PINIB|nr:hypothetical protein FSP39_025110 [Pinctada imbricata]